MTGAQSQWNEMYVPPGTASNLFYLRWPAHKGKAVESSMAGFMPLLSPLMSPFYVSIWHRGHSVHLILSGCF